MRLLLDTNITIDILTNRQPYCKNSVACFRHAIMKRDKIYISTVSVADVMYITRKHFSNKKKQLSTVLNFIDLLKIAKVNSKDLHFAFSGKMNDFEDALQTCCAKRHHVDFIITRNVKDFNLSPVKAVSPEDYFNLPRALG